MSHRTLVATAILAAIATPAVGGLAFMHFGWVAGIAATLAIVGVAFAATTILLRDFADALQGLLHGTDEHGRPNPRPEREAS